MVSFITYDKRRYQVQGGKVYMCKLSKAGEWHWARVPSTYHRVLTAVLALHEKEKEQTAIAA